MRNELPVIACSLDAAGLADRLDEFKALYSSSLLSSERTPGGAVLRFRGSDASAVRDLLDKEQRCCPFWDFAFVDDGDDFVVTIGAPAEAQPLLDGLLSLA